MSSFTEQEIKFRLPEGGDARLLGRVRATIEAAGFRLEPQAVVTHEDRYLDTDDWVLYRAGIALRLRADGRRVRLEAKTLRSQSEEAMVRTEWSQDAPAEELPWIAEGLEPGAVTALLAPLRGLGIPERLEVVARIRAERECFQWLKGDDPIGLVTVDHVALPGGTNGAAETPRRFDEVEIELSNGHREALLDVRRAVESGLGLRANVDSKLASALAAAGLTAPGREERLYSVDVGDRLVDVAWKTLARQFGRLEWNDPGARLGVDIEYVHDMRVASRRLRMALEVFADAVPDEARNRFAEDLRYVGRTLGRVRDLDVGLERVAVMAEEAGEAGGSGAEERQALSIFAGDLSIRRARRRLELVDALDSERYANLRAAAGGWVSAGPPAPGSVPCGGIPAFYAGTRLVATAELATEAAYDEAARELTPETLHALRLAAKRLRYTLEFLAPVLGNASAVRAKRIARFQDFLGVHQDAIGLLRRLRKYARTIPRRDKALTLGAGSALGALERATRMKRGELREAWAAISL
jgi:CHAD domain-containing protein